MYVSRTVFGEVSIVSGSVEMTLALYYTVTKWINIVKFSFFKYIF